MLNTIKIVMIFSCIFILFAQKSAAFYPENIEFEVPAELDRIDFRDTNFSGKTFQINYKNTNDKNRYSDFVKYYGNKRLVLHEFPTTTSFGISASKQPNQYCIRDDFNYELDCVFVFTDGEAYFISDSNSTDGIKAKYTVFDTPSQILNSCDMQASPSNSVVGSFFDIGLGINDQKVLRQSQQAASEGGIFQRLKAKIGEIFDVCIQETKADPNRGANWINLFVSAQINIILNNNNIAVSSETLDRLVMYLDNADWENVTNYTLETNYYKAALQRKGILTGLNQLQRPEQHWAEEYDSYYLYDYLVALRGGNLSVLNELAVDIIDRYQSDSALGQSTFSTYYKNPRAYDDEYLQFFLSLLKVEFAQAGGFTDLLVKGKEEQLKRKLNDAIISNSDDYVLVMLTDFIIENIDTSGDQEFYLKDIYSTAALIAYDTVVQDYAQSWRNQKVYDYMSYYVRNIPDIFIYDNEDSLVHAYQVLGVLYGDNAKDFSSAITYTEKAIELQYKFFGNTNDNLENNLNIYRNADSSRSAFNKAKLPTRLPLAFYCSSDVRMKSGLYDGGEEYGIGAVQAVLSMNVLNNSDALRSFVNNSSYSCIFDTNAIVQGANTVKLQRYKDDWLIFKIRSSDGSSLYSATKYKF